VILFRCLAWDKAASARVNADLGLIDREKAERIAAAGDRIANGEFDDQFPIDVFQTGSGTSSNMNANEVIAALAGADVHPNDHVNMGQSSNDVFPSAVHLAALGELTSDLVPALDSLAASLERKVYPVPREIDEEIARLKLETMGVTIDQLTEEQAKYLASWDEGT